MTFGSQHINVNFINFYDLLYDPRTVTSDKKPYTLALYKSLVAEAYRITRNLHTPYSDVMEMSVLERKYIIEFLDMECKEIKKKNEEMKQQLESRKHK